MKLMESAISLRGKMSENIFSDVVINTLGIWRPMDTFKTVDILGL